MIPHPPLRNFSENSSVLEWGCFPKTNRKFMKWIECPGFLTINTFMFQCIAQIGSWKMKVKKTTLWSQYLSIPNCLILMGGHAGKEVPGSWLWWFYRWYFQYWFFFNFSSFFNCQNKNWLVKKSPVPGCVGFTDDPDHPGSGRPPVSPWLEGTAGRDSLSFQRTCLQLLKIYN